jgi:hypothetical protein
VSLDGLFDFLRSGLDSPAPESPAQTSHSMPRLGDIPRALANMLRYGIRSPKP